jgi:two-component system, NtrC family, response regulator
MGKVILIEDRQEIREIARSVIAAAGHMVISPLEWPEGFGLLKTDRFDLAIVEVQPLCDMSDYKSWLKDEQGGSGRDSLLPFIINQILRAQEAPPFILIANKGFPAEARHSIEKGAVGYVEVPRVTEEGGKTVIDSPRFKEKLIAATEWLPPFVDRDKFDDLDLKGIVGSSVRMRRTLMNLADAARNDFTLMITGEVGTGKKLFAKKIHDNSERRQGPFTVIDCSSLRKEDLGRDRFPYMYLGSRSGRMVGGSILLYEVGYLSTKLQRDLMTFLVHNDEPYASMFKKQEWRIISASSRNFDDLIGSGQFRLDLYNKLSPYSFQLPALPEIKDDIPAIVSHYVNVISEKIGRRYLPKLSDGFLEDLGNYSWLGNFNELISMLQTVMSAAEEGDFLDSCDIPIKIKQKAEAKLFARIFEQVSKVRRTSTLSDQPEEDTQDQGDVIGGLGENLTVGQKGKPAFCFYPKGEYWIIGESEKTVMLKTKKGFDFVRFLLGRPNEFFMPVQVYYGDSSVGTERAEYYDVDLQETGEETYTLERLDAKTKEAYRLRIEELKEKLEAQDYEDQEGALELKEEIQDLSRKLASGKLPRDAKSEHERSRSNVTRAISRVLSDIHKHVPALAQYLNRSTIQTGDSISYRPIVGSEPAWILEPEQHSKK